MINRSPNRIAGLLPAPWPVPRTAAQQAASQANGRKSRGPRTVAGKAKTSLNALRHGLLARNYAPPADMRNQDVLYRRIHSALTDEYRPRTFTAAALVAGLASDFVQLSRIRTMLEYLQKPQLDPESQAAWEKVADRQRWQRRMESTLTETLAGRVARLMAPAAEVFESRVIPRASKIELFLAVG